MKIPFTSPKFQELDVLSDEARSAILKDYAVSAGARRAVGIAKTLLFVALGLGLLGCVTPILLEPASGGRSMAKAVVIFSWSLGGCAVILAIVCYRILAQRTLRAILVERLSPLAVKKANQ